MEPSLTAFHDLWAFPKGRRGGLSGGGIDAKSGVHDQVDVWRSAGFPLNRGGLGRDTILLVRALIHREWGAVEGDGLALVVGETLGRIH